MERKTKKGIVVNQKAMLIIRVALAVILLCLIAVFIQKDNISAAENPESVPAGDYHKGDIEIINSIIEDNGLDSFEKDDLVGWETLGMVVWNQDSPKRIVTLQIKKNLLEGKLDVSGLTELTSLIINEDYYTSGAGLKELKVTGLTKLTNMDISKNSRLKTITLDGLEQLSELICFNNDNLTELNIKGLTNLTKLQCNYNNKLSSLDVSGLTNLKELKCSMNNLTDKRLDQNSKFN